MNLPITQLSTAYLPPANKVLLMQFLDSIDAYAQTRRFTYVAEVDGVRVKKSALLLALLVNDCSLEVKGFCLNWAYQYLRTSTSEYATAFRQQYNGAVPPNSLDSAGVVILDYRGKGKHAGFYFLPLTNGTAQNSAIYMQNSTKFGKVIQAENRDQIQHPHSRRRTA